MNGTDGVDREIRLAWNRSPANIAGMCLSRPDDDLDSDIRMRLNRALSRALKSRDTIAVSALRSAIGAIGNAEAPAAGTASPATASGPHFAGTAAGLGAGETQRRRLSGAHIDEIVRAEISERQAAARQYEQAGHADRAARLRNEAHVLMAVVLDEDQAGA
jgi:uncharacterized protein